jgi:hypothetical protein
MNCGDRRSSPLQGNQELSSVNPERIIHPVGGFRRRVFSEMDDRRLTELVLSGQHTNWSDIAAKIPGKNTRQCRDRWRHYLAPTNVCIEWTTSEDQLMVEKLGQYGFKWGKIAKFFPGRDETAIKCRWHSNLEKRCTITDQGTYTLGNYGVPPSNPMNAPSGAESKPSSSGCDWDGWVDPNSVNFCSFRENPFSDAAQSPEWF